MKVAVRFIVVAASAGLALTIRRANQRWFESIGRAEPRRSRWFAAESRAADLILVLMVLLVTLAMIAA